MHRLHCYSLECCYDKNGICIANITIRTHRKGKEIGILLESFFEYDLDLKDFLLFTCSYFDLFEQKAMVMQKQYLKYT